MKQIVKRTAWFLFVTCCLAGCGKDGDGPSPEPPPGNGGEGVTVDNVTYANFAGGLFQSRCSSCHTGSGPGTVQWVFSGYGSVRDNLARINDAVIVRKIMPQDGSLTNRQFELLKAWIDKGAPQ
ncbi:hypothetical protein GCM10011386_06800 [Parapedobacter defluvii]|uniref:Cytochrome c domain-containing protein n=1 Tax=Parapedobacter defluvii TaxID=2045106 RepID=A0ABQ1L3T5_9SPHI|nr:hypothetical protein [Parapedobacter defluvii]GGC17570.1 hypothetical protein GCM10011386_06800 [Parapedobacter defluvii]